MNNFKQEEFTCDGEVVFDKMDAEFLKKLDSARTYADTPFKLNSTWRSPEHNADVGGSPTSSHLYGVAVDISAGSSAVKFKIINGLLKAGFTRIGVGSNFIHADTDENKVQNVLWTY